MPFLLPAVGALLIAVGIALVVGVFTGRPRLVDAAGIRLTKVCQFLLGICLSYSGIGAVARSLGKNVVNFKLLMTLIGTLIVIAFVGEVKRIIEAIRYDRKDNHTDEKQAGPKQ